MHRSHLLISNPAPEHVETVLLSFGKPIKSVVIQRRRSLSAQAEHRVEVHLRLRRAQLWYVILGSQRDHCERLRTRCGHAAHSAIELRLTKPSGSDMEVGIRFTLLQNLIRVVGRVNCGCTCVGERGHQICGERVLG
jgi:hypothetical protein